MFSQLYFLKNSEKRCIFPTIESNNSCKNIQTLMVKKFILFFALILSPFSASAFLGEDLGLDLYKQIDENFDDLERQQYEYEPR